MHKRHKLVPKKITRMQENLVFDAHLFPRNVEMKPRLLSSDINFVFSTSVM